MNHPTSLDSLVLGPAEVLPAPRLLPEKAPGEHTSLTSQSRGQADPASEPAWREILRLWLTWNEVHEQVGARMFKSGENLQELEDLLDHADQLRFEAIRRSKSLLTGGRRSVNR
jgi:hypothetical protein